MDPIRAEIESISYALPSLTSQIGLAHSFHFTRESKTKGTLHSHFFLFGKSQRLSERIFSFQSSPPRKQKGLFLRNDPPAFQNISF